MNWNAPTCSTGSFVFDNNTTMDASLSQRTLFSGSSFNCTVKDSAGNTVGSLAWDNATKTLTVNGTIFIDGDITLGGGTVNYKGNGTIYDNGSLNGGANFSGTSVCAPTVTAVPENGCPGPWNYPTTQPPAAGTGSLEFVFINPNNVSTPVNLQGSGHEFQVTLFVVKGFTSNGGTAILGPVLADGGSMAGNTGVDVPPIRPRCADNGRELEHLRCLGRDARQLEAAQVNRRGDSSGAARERGTSSRGNRPGTARASHRDHALDRGRRRSAHAGRGRVRVPPAVRRERNGAHARRSPDGALPRSLVPLHPVVAQCVRVDLRGISVHDGELERLHDSARHLDKPGARHLERQPGLHRRRHGPLRTGPDRDRAGSAPLRDRHVHHAVPEREHHLLPRLGGSRETGVRRRARRDQDGHADRRPRGLDLLSSTTATSSRASTRPEQQGGRVVARP